MQLKQEKWRILEIYTIADILSEHFPVNLYFELAKNPACRMYVGYYFGEWHIEYTTDENIRRRADMIRTGRFKTDKEIYAKVQEVIGILSKAKSTTHHLG